MTKSKIKKQTTKIYGKELILDLYDCDLRILKSKKKLREFPKKICGLININCIGNPIIARTGKGDLVGYSLVQFLETSSIIIHTSEPISEIHLNIFVCKLFNTKEIIDFTKKFFNAKKIKKQLLIR